MGCFHLLRKGRLGYTTTHDAPHAPQVTLVRQPGETLARVHTANDTDRVVWDPEPDALDPDGKCARFYQSGTYRCLAVTQRSIESEAVVIEVEEPWRIPRITQYDVTPASTRFSKDGQVRVTIEGVPKASTAKLLWTTGTSTTEPVLRNVRPGAYAAIVVAVDDGEAECLHCCPPALVEVRSMDIESMSM